MASTTCAAWPGLAWPGCLAACSLAWLAHGSLLRPAAGALARCTDWPGTTQAGRPGPAYCRADKPAAAGWRLQAAAGSRGGRPLQRPQAGGPHHSARGAVLQWVANWARGRLALHMPLASRRWLAGWLAGCVSWLVRTVDLGLGGAHAAGAGCSRPCCHAQALELCQPTALLPAAPCPAAAAGNFLDGKLKGTKGGAVYAKHGEFAPGCCTAISPRPLWDWPRRRRGAEPAG
jgi:hypothetical protein